MTDQPMRIETASLPWETTSVSGVERKELKGEIALLRLASGVALSPAESDSYRELFVLEGALQTGSRSLSAEGYAVQRADSDAVAGPSGCILFLRQFTDPQGATEEILCASSERPWQPGQGGLRVKPLGTSSALVHWPANERFLPHKHWGGEEIFVLSGTFRDEHGTYPTGTWLQSPHLSAHHPFVEEETVIWVKTGHLHPDATSM